MSEHWTPFPDPRPAFDFAGERLREVWPLLHAGDREPFPDRENIAGLIAAVARLGDTAFGTDAEKIAAELQDAWRAFHRGEFREAFERGLGAGPLGQAIAITADGDVFVADGGNNHRIQVFDTNGTYKRQFPAVGNPQAICLTTGANPVLYVSNTNPPNNIDTAGEIYKMDLNGKLLGKFGRAGKMLKEFGTTNAIDCRNPNQLYVGEIGNLRVQKITLR